MKSKAMDKWGTTVMLKFRRQLRADEMSSRWLSFWSSEEKFSLKIRGSRTEPCAVPHLDEKMRPQRGEIVEA